MAPKTLTRKELGRATLARQMLLERERMTAVKGVERLAGMQSQEAKHPYIGLWTRVEGFDAAKLNAALHERKLVRATLMRGTLHLLSARDYPMFRAALEPAMELAARVMGSRAKGIDPDELLPVARELFEESPREFKELRPLLAERFPDLYDRGLAYMTRLRLPLVMVPTGDRYGFSASSRFTLAEEWLGKPVGKSSAPGRLIQRYLAAFGPATPADFQTWAGLQNARPAFEKLGPKLAEFRDERGRELFDLPDAPRPSGDTEAPVRFLPEFDNLLLAHEDRTRVIADEHRPLVATKNLRIKATFLVDGEVRGTWRIESRRRRATLHIEPFGKLPKRTASALAAEGERLLGFAEPDAAGYDVEV